MAIGRGALEHGHANCTRRTRLVLDHHGLVENLAQLLCDQPGADVAGTARGLGTMTLIVFEGKSCAGAASGIRAREHARSGARSHRCNMSLSQHPTFRRPWPARLSRSRNTASAAVPQLRHPPHLVAGK